MQKKRYSLTKVKSRNFLTTIDCFMYILFNLNPFFLEPKFGKKYDRECVRMLWTYLVPNEFYIFICKHDNFNVLNKLSLKYQNTSEIVNDSIVKNNGHFLRLKEYLKKMHRFYQCIYATLIPKYLCRMDDYGVKSRLLLLPAVARKMKNKIYILFMKC